MIHGRRYPLRSRLAKQRRRRAISEVIGAMVTIGVTLTVGFVAWAWINSAAQSTESNFGNSITENFSIVDANFSSASATIMLSREPPRVYVLRITNQHSAPRGVNR